MLVRAGTTNVLINAGLSIKKISSFLTKIGLSQGELTGILLTHEHADHSHGATAVSRRYHAPIYGNAATFREVYRRNSLKFVAHEFVTGTTIRVGSWRFGLSLCVTMRRNRWAM